MLKAKLSKIMNILEDFTRWGYEARIGFSVIAIAYIRLTKSCANSGVLRSLPVLFTYFKALFRLPPFRLFSTILFATFRSINLLDRLTPLFNLLFSFHAPAITISNVGTSFSIFHSLYTTKSVSFNLFRRHFVTIRSLTTFRDIRQILNAIDQVNEEPLINQSVSRFGKLSDFMSNDVTAISPNLTNNSAFVRVNALTGFSLMGIHPSNVMTFTDIEDFSSEGIFQRVDKMGYNRLHGTSSNLVSSLKGVSASLRHTNFTPSLYHEAASKAIPMEVRTS